jgi:hypothetical protein
LSSDPWQKIRKTAANGTIEENSGIFTVWAMAFDRRVETTSGKRRNANTNHHHVKNSPPPASVPGGERLMAPALLLWSGRFLIGTNTGRKAMKALAVTLALLVSSTATAQECQICSAADACIKTYLKATSEAQKATKQAIRDWKQNLDRKASAEFFSKGTLALEGAMDSEIRSDLDRLKECLAKIR